MKGFYPYFIRTISPLLILLLGLQGCVTNEEKAFKIDKYFNLKKLVDYQLAYYRENPPESIKKTFILEGKKEKKTQNLNSLEEIKTILESANINKPGFRGIYKVKKAHETEGNDTLSSVIENDLKTEESANVERIKAYYQGPPKRKNLYAVLIYKNRDNFLYKNSQLIALKNFEDGYLKKLTIEGKQTILFFNPSWFKVQIQIEK